MGCPGNQIIPRKKRRMLFEARFPLVGAILVVMSMLSPRLQLRVQQKQILTPGLVQMVTVLQLNRLELKDMITQEVAQNPILEEGQEGDELTPAEIQSLLEAERVADPADQSVLDVSGNATADYEAYEYDAPVPATSADGVASPGTATDPVGDAAPDCCRPRAPRQVASMYVIPCKQRRAEFDFIRLNLHRAKLSDCRTHFQ